MNYKNKLEISKPTCVGIGLVALDVLFSDKLNTPIGFYAGGSCGNVMAILSYLGWETFPIARLRNNEAGNILIRDLENFGVNNSLISMKEDGSTPIIIHRVLKGKDGNPKHRFEFRDPETGGYLPSYKPVLSACVDSIFESKPKSDVFYLDRVNRASIEMAKKSKEQNAFIFFEPSSYKDDKIHRECLSYADIVKFSNDRITNYQDLFPICERELEIMTQGDEGLLYRLRNQRKWTSIPAYDISCLVDAAGSGDWCTSGIIYSLFGQFVDIVFDLQKVESALKFGQALAALNCSFMGARGIMYAMEKDVFLDTIDNFFSNTNYTDYSQYSNAIKRVRISEDLTLGTLY